MQRNARALQIATLVTVAAMAGPARADKQGFGCYLANNMRHISLIFPGFMDDFAAGYLGKLRERIEDAFPHINVTCEPQGDPVPEQVPPSVAVSQTPPAITDPQVEPDRPVADAPVRDAPPNVAPQPDASVAQTAPDVAVQQMQPAVADKTADACAPQASGDRKIPACAFPASALPLQLHGR